MGVDKFVDIVSKYSSIGIKQRGQLRDATLEAFNDKKLGDYPSFGEINEKLLDIVGDKRDTLTEIMDEISRYNIFQDSRKGQSFLNQNVYLSLSGDLSSSVRFTSLFLVINYIYNSFMNMESTEVEDGIRSMRYVILIDEAHVLFKERKYQEMLEKILREIRSKGVSVVMLSQGIDEFSQVNFDFSSMCELAFLLDIKDKNNSKGITKFMGYSEKGGQFILKKLESMLPGLAISNMKEIKGRELFILKQFQ